MTLKLNSVLSHFLLLYLLPSQVLREVNFVGKLSPVFIHVLIISTVAGAIFFTNLGTARLWDQDEPRNAGCAKEMLARGDWVVPIFNNELRAQKPVLLYWLMMSAYSVFGVNEFSARFWSALLGLGTVLATYFVGQRLFQPAVGLLAAIALCSCTMFSVAARAATPDSLLIFCGTMALLIYVNGTFSGRSISNSLSESGFPDRRGAVWGLYFFLGLGTLAKGPVGFLLPMAIIGMFMLLYRREPCHKADSSNRWMRIWNWSKSVFHPTHFAKTVWAMRPVTAMVIVLGIAAPWYALVGIQTEGDFLNLFFLKENLARATSAMESHSGGPAYYLAAISFGFFPWSVLAVPVVIGVFNAIKQEGLNEQSTDQQRYELRAVQFLVCWVVVQVGLFSFASTKLPSYVTPCYPALALLTGFVLHAFVTRAQAVTIWYRLALATFVVSGIGMVVGMVYVGGKYLENDYRLVLLGMIPILGGGVGLYFLQKSNRRSAVGAFVIAALVLAIGIFGFGTVVVDKHKTTDKVFDKVKELDQPLATFGVMESSWVFYSDRQVYELVTPLAANKRRRQTLERKQPWHRTPWVTPEFFIAQNPEALILTTEARVEALLRRLPRHEVIDSTEYFLKEDRLALIGPRSEN